MATKIIQMMEKTTGGYDELIPVGGGIVFRVTSVAGTTVTCSLGEGDSQTYTYLEDGTYDFYGAGYGVYTFTFTDDSGTNTFTKIVSESKIYEIYKYPISEILNESSWSQISLASAKGIAQNMWSIGDIKMITVNGTITNSNFNGYYGVFIASFSHNPAVEGSGILFHSFKNDVAEKKDIALYANFQMNTTSITDGGWRDCHMRKNIIPQFEKAIPSDLSGVVKASTIYSHNYTGGSQNDKDEYVTTTQDRFYLLAEFENFGNRSYANSYEKNHQVQVEYYKLGNSRIKYQSTKPSSTSDWWERSVWCGTADTYNFCNVSGSGFEVGQAAHVSYGFAVAFRV